MEDAIKIFVGNTASGATTWEALEGVTRVVPIVWDDPSCWVRSVEIAVCGVVHHPAPGFDKLYAAYQSGDTHECKVTAGRRGLAGPFFVTARTETVSAGVLRYLMNLYAAGAMTETGIAD